MNGHFNLYAELRKIEDEDDETVKVSGYASSEVVESAGEIVTASAIRDALPDYFRDGTGALREMHSMVAAGVVIEAEIDAKNRTAIVAKVVDPSTIRKLRAGVFKGLSIGGKTLARDPKNNKVITKIRLDEISLVDRPSNPEATLDVWKAAGHHGDGAVRKATAAVDYLETTLADIARRLTNIEDAERGARK
jgi:hypothetical protein